MANNLDPVVATVSVAGNEIHFYSLELHQAFNAHHTFRIITDFENLEEKWMEDPTDQIKLIGEEVTIIFEHKVSGNPLLFSGIIGGISYTGYHGNQNSIVISGYSPTIRLAGKPAMDSFIDLPLQQIVQEAVSNSGNGGSVTVKPQMKSKLDFIYQYNENCWDFLNRLSWQFCEWLLYDGQNCYFGLKYGKTVTIEYDKEMTYFDLSANLAPSKFNFRHFLKHDNKEIDSDPPDDVPGVRGYLQLSKSRSESIYTSEVTSQILPDINTKKDLDDLAKAEKSRSVGEMLIMRGETQTCKVQIGNTVNIKLPEKMDIAIKEVDRFLVTGVSHRIDQEGHYSNRFSGILDGLEVIPMEEPKLPVVGPQIATVKDNADPRERGLIKVQFQWQKAKNKTTNWIRVSSQDAGKSEKVGTNRGFVTIPEKDDLVMVGFEYGDSSRPFVMGSIFPENVSKGGGQGNKTKSITTRSGVTVILDDDENKGSATVKDPSGNVIKLDGNGNISITAPKTVSITCTDFKVNSSNSIVMDSKPGKNGGTGKININAKEHIQVNSETADIALTAQAGNITLAADKGTLGVSSKETKMNSKGNTTQSSGGVFKITGASNVEINK